MRQVDAKLIAAGFGVLLVLNTVFVSNKDWTRYSDKVAYNSTFVVSSSLSSLDSVVESSVTRTPRLADGCYHIYLDVGANIGIHGRFLYEPEKYPKSRKAVPLFEEMYGKNRSNEDFCVFEIEANPSHWERLDSVSTAYKNVGWRYQIVKAAAFDKPGTMTFYHQGTDRRRSEFGFSIKSMGNTDNEHFSKVEVPTLRLADWIQTELLERQIPATPPSGTTYEKPIFGMKFDIEASELVVLPDMLMTGVMCKIDFMFGEYHTFLVPMEFENPNVTVKNEGQVRFLRNAMKGILGTARNCQTSFIIMDDEEYLHDGKPLPGDQQ